MFCLNIRYEGTKLEIMFFIHEIQSIPTLLHQSDLRGLIDRENYRREIIPRESVHRALMHEGYHVVSICMDHPLKSVVFRFLESYFSDEENNTERGKFWSRAAHRCVFRKFLPVIDTTIMHTIISTLYRNSLSTRSMYRNPEIMHKGSTVI